VEAAVVLEVSVRQVRRLLAAYRQEGVAALAHGNRGRRRSCWVGDGATVYAIGRSVRGGEPTTWYGWGTMEVTAELATTDVDGQQPPAFSVAHAPE
jgi:hypothetical protein